MNLKFKSQELESLPIYLLFFVFPVSNVPSLNWYNMIQSSWLHLEENDWLLAYSHISTLVEKTTVDRFQLTPHQPNQAILVSQKDPPNQIKQKLHSTLASQNKNPAGKKKQTTGPWSRPLRPPTWQVFFPVAPWYRNFWCLRSASAFNGWFPQNTLKWCRVLPSDPALLSYKRTMEWKLKLDFLLL